jgi:hypothetical protein
MLAYVFWHRSFPNIERAAYENSIRRFQEALARNPSPGLDGAASWRTEAVPWLGDHPGYEDWCFLQGSWAMDPLNAFAVAGDRQPSHDVVAAQMGAGAGGLYTHIWGDVRKEATSTVFWLTRPRGIQWRPPLEAVRASVPSATFWRRQMVLGPGLEFAVEVPGDATIPVPPSWQARSIRRERLTP